MLWSSTPLVKFVYQQCIFMKPAFVQFLEWWWCTFSWLFLSLYPEFPVPFSNCQTFPFPFIFSWGFIPKFPSCSEKVQDNTIMHTHGWNTNEGVGFESHMAAMEKVHGEFDAQMLHCQCARFQTWSKRETKLEKSSSYINPQYNLQFVCSRASVRHFGIVSKILALSHTEPWRS